MGFLQIKRESVYLTIDATVRMIRPLLKEAVGKWVHMIPSCSVSGPDGKPQLIRRFCCVDADFSSWMKNNQDPLWDRLDNMDRWNRAKERQDFSMRPQHIIPVWSYQDNDVKVVKQGNQFFEEMVKFYDAGGDVTSCDWLCWTEGSGRTTKYLTTRQDRSPFNPGVDPTSLGPKVQAVMTQAISDLRPFKTEEDMLKYIFGKVADEDAAFPYGANQAPQIPQSVTPPVSQQVPSVPQYMPGGQPVVPYTTVPSPVSAPPAQQPVWAPPVTNQVPMGWTPPSTTAAPQQPVTTSVPQWTPPTTTVVPPQSWGPPPVSTMPSYVAPGAYTQAMQPQPPRVEVPNAPVNSAPVFAPPQPILTGNPADFVVSSGKHAGKTLGWIKENAPDYLSFLKGNKKELIPLIEQLLGTPSATPPPVNQPHPQVAVQQSQDDDAMRSQLIREINQKIMSIPEFQGQGIATKMMPFLQQTIGTTAFSEAPLDQLQTLKNAVDAKISARA